MRHLLARGLCLLLVLALCLPALAEDTHFVPENPDQMPAETVFTDIDLNERLPLDREGLGEMTANGVHYADGTTKKILLPLPFRMKKGDSVIVAIEGRFDSEKDKGITVNLSNSILDNCAQMSQSITQTAPGEFYAEVELVASKNADCLLLYGHSLFSSFQDLTISAVKVDSPIAANGHKSLSYTESVQQPWYQDMLDKAVLNVGSGVRMREVIARAQSGENITIATIGGSITEGAGATRYRECYAYRIYEGFKQRYGAGDGSNVHFVNAGVGGTPSTFGFMRWQRDVVDRVQDDDGLPDLVVIEYAVNDGGEPTNHRCYESLVRTVLAQPNHPAVILLFSVFPSGYTLQKDIAPIGYAADLLMISMRDSAFPYVDDKWMSESFFYDEYHPTTLGHHVMGDCVLYGIETAAAMGSDVDNDPDAAPAYGLDYMGLTPIFRDQLTETSGVNLGSFTADDTTSYTNQPVGRVCGPNFQHRSGVEPLTFTANCKNLLIAYRTMSDASYGNAEVWIDGHRMATLRANTGSWGQSVVDLVLNQPVSAEHTIEIRMQEGSENKKFTITCLAYTP